MAVSEPNIGKTSGIDASYMLFPATACQIRFWQEQEGAPDASALNVAFRLQLDGTVDASAIETAIGRLIDRHEVLRTGFLTTSEGLKQQVWSHVDFTLRVIDLRGLNDEQAEAVLKEAGQTEAHTPFPLTTRSFLRAIWLPKAAGTGELLLTFHSLIMDGWSFAIFTGELLDALSALSKGGAPAWPEIDLHHGDYALWKEELMASGAIEASRAYWRAELANFKPFVVAGDRPRLSQRRYKSAIRSLLLPASLSDRLTRTAQDAGVTLFSQAAASLSAALSKSTGKTEIAFSTQVSVRDQQELETVMGPLINTVVLRADMTDDASLAGLAGEFSAKLGEAVNHAHFPFEEMIAMATDAASPSSPLCSVNLALQQGFIGKGDHLSRDGITAVAPPSFNTGALYDLSFFMVGRPEGWRISCEGDTDLFDVETIDRHLALWREALEAMANAPDQPVSQSLAVPTAKPVQSAGSRSDSAFMTKAQFDATLKQIVRFNMEGTQTPIIAFNNVAVFYELSRQLGADQPLIDIPMVPAGGPRELPLRAFEDIAADAVRLVRAAQPKGPYRLMGLCVLGSLAFEAARQLRRDGEVVEEVILNDSWCPRYREAMPWYDRILRKLQVQSYNIPRDFKLAMTGQVPMVRYLNSYRLIRRLRIVDLALKFGWLKGEASAHLVNENTWYTDYLLAQQTRYEPLAYDGAIQIFRSQQARKGRLFAHELGWKSVATGRLTVTEVPAFHDEMFRAAGAAVIGKQLRENSSLA